MSDFMSKQYSLFPCKSPLSLVWQPRDRYGNDGTASMANIHDHCDVHAFFGRGSTDPDVKMSFVIEEQLSYQGEQRSALCINVQHLYHDLLCTAQNN